MRRVRRAAERGACGAADGVALPYMRLNIAITSISDAPGGGGGGLPGAFAGVRSADAAARCAAPDQLCPGTTLCRVRCLLRSA